MMYQHVVVYNIDLNLLLIIEGSNLYYTQSRVDTSFDNRLYTKSTSQLLEGSNLYYTQIRVDTSFDNKFLTKSTSQVPLQIQRAVYPESSLPGMAYLYIISLKLLLLSYYIF